MPEADEGSRRSGPGSVGAQISTEAVRLFRKYTGRGPTRAQTTLNGETAYIVLRETLSPSEKEMVAGGHREQVQQIRTAYQEVMRSELVEMVERNLGRKVVAFVSSENIDPEIAVALFVLDGAKPSRKPPTPA
jgi:uncharacterized protein YbcI